MEFAVVVPVVAPCLAESLEAVPSVRYVSDDLAYLVVAVEWHCPLLYTWELVVPVYLEVAAVASLSPCVRCVEWVVDVDALSYVVDSATGIVLLAPCLFCAFCVWHVECLLVGHPAVVLAVPCRLILWEAEPRI